MAMYNRSRISDAKIVKLSLRSMLMGGVEIYRRCAKCVVPEGVRHRVNDGTTSATIRLVQWGITRGISQETSLPRKGQLKKNFNIAKRSV